MGLVGDAISIILLPKDKQGLVVRLMQDFKFDPKMCLTCKLITGEGWLGPGGLRGRLNLCGASSYERRDPGTILYEKGRTRPSKGAAVHACVYDGAIEDGLGRRVLEPSGL